MITALLLPLAFFDFGASDEGLVTTGATGQWEWGLPTSGPRGSATVWGTVLDGLHFNDTRDELEVPLPSLDGAVAPVVVFRHWYDIRAGDRGHLELNDGSGWREVDPVYGYPDPDGFVGKSGGWVEDAVSLAGLGPSPRLRFVLDADPVQAGDGWYLAAVEVWDGDAVPPRIRPHAIPVDTQDVSGPYPVTVEVLEDTQLDEVLLVVRGGSGAEKTIVMQPAGDDRYEALIPGQPPGTTVSWYVLASDLEQQARWPEAGEASFRVFLAAPTGLAGPPGRVVGHEIALTWSPPDSPHPVTGYRVVRHGEPPLDVLATTASVPVGSSGSQTWTVSAVYDLGVGDPSAPLTLEVEVPRVDPLEPAEAFQGDHLYLRVRGDALYLHAEVTTVELGPGVRVEEIEVLGSNAAVAVIAVDPDASIGPRALRLSGVHGAFVFADAFSVRDGAERPRVLEVAPAAITQGSVERLEIRASRPFGGAVRVDPGPGLVVTSDVEVDGDVVSFDLLARGDAPIGRRTVVLDDGDRLWDASVLVLERRFSNRSCAAGGGARGPWWLVALAIGWRRRLRGGHDC